MSIVAIFGLFTLLIVLGLPVAFALLGTGFVSLALAPRLNMMIAPQQIVDSIDSFPLLAIPFFLLAGFLMNRAGVTQHLIALAQTLFGHVRGGLAHTTIGAGALMAGGSGSGTADSAALGTVMIPAMKREGYPPAFATAITACAGSLAPIIPPSIIYILYGHLGNVSVGTLFLAGIVPGILFAAVLICVSWAIAIRGGYGHKAARASVGEVGRALWRSVLDLMLPVIIMGGIVGGIFTPTEAGAVAVAYVLFIGAAIYRTLTFANVYDALREAVVILGSVMLILAAAGLVQFVLALMQAGQVVGGFLASLSDSRFVILLVISLLLLALGSVLEVTAVLILMTPILVPIVRDFGIDPVQFGVLMAMNLTVGLLTPPVGLSMYVTCAIGRVQIGAYARAFLPFLAALIALIAVIALVPEISLWLPGVLAN